MVRTAVLLFLGSSLALADERTQRLANRLAEEASAFQQVAPRVLGSETLEQRARFVDLPGPRGGRGAVDQ